MLAARVRVLGFRNLGEQEVELGPQVSLLHGPNGAGKTNLLESLLVALVGRSPRTRRDREMIAFGEALARVEVDVADDPEAATFLWSVGRDGERRHLVDGSAVTEGAAARRPPLAVFLPDRLALIKGPPAERRSHLDHLIATLRPSRAALRSRYGRALAQRNALLGRIRSGMAPPDSLDAWDAELAGAGFELMVARGDAVEVLGPEFRHAATDLGLTGEAGLRYAPRSGAATRGELEAELAERRSGDVERGYSQHGPHLDDLSVELDRRALRRYGSQGQQRLALLALLFAERRALMDARGTAPLMLLDDVMSELDPPRRERLADRLAEGGGQTVITATEADQVPGKGRVEIAVRDGAARPPSTAPAVSTAFAA